jgi:hypothetical protein
MDFLFVLGECICEQRTFDAIHGDVRTKYRDRNRFQEP